MSKPPFTQKAWFEALRHQQERETMEHERICQAVADSNCPLPQNLVQSVAQLPLEMHKAAMANHPGSELAERRSTYRASLSTMGLGVTDLLTAIDSFANEANTTEGALFHHVNSGRLEHIKGKIQKELFCVVNGAASLVEHTRRVQKIVEFPDYNEQRVECFGDDGLHEFVIGLRILLHHLHLVEANWLLQNFGDEDGRRAMFTVSRDDLLSAMFKHTKKFSASQRGPIEAYLATIPKNLDLAMVFEEYQNRLRRFHEWFSVELGSDTLIDLMDYDRCTLERRRYGSRMSWNMFLGNWLKNWETPPNPHDHLHRFLTEEQLSEIYDLPRNSKAQVDLVIGYVDIDNAITEELRQMAYELFERSPAAVTPESKKV